MKVCPPLPGCLHSPIAYIFQCESPSADDQSSSKYSWHKRDYQAINETLADRDCYPEFAFLKVNMLFNF